MTTYYVDATLSTGANDGSSQSDAWQSLQEAIDSTNNAGKPAAGDTVLCRHTASPDETLAAIIDVDGTTGDLTSGRITWKGVNSSWVEDGTRYELDANSAAANCLRFNSVSVDLTVWKHFSFTGATSSGVYFGTSGSIYHDFVNCVAHTNGAYGFDFYRNSSGKAIGCLAYGNTTTGFFSGSYFKYLFCCARDNTQRGFYDAYGVSVKLFGCLAFDNGWEGIRVDANAVVINCTSDGNTRDCLWLGDHYTTILGNRLTNAPATYHGLVAGSKDAAVGFNYFEDNAAGDIENGTLIDLSIFDFDGDTDTNQYDQADTNEGYTSRTEGSEDYNLRSDATLRRTAIQIPTGQ